MAATMSTSDRRRGDATRKHGSILDLICELCDLAIAELDAALAASVSAYPPGQTSFFIAIFRLHAEAHGNLRWAR